MGWKTGEGWSYEWCNDYTTTGRQIVIEEEKSETNSINFAVKRINVIVSAANQ